MMQNGGWIKDGVGDFVQGKFKPGLESHGNTATTKKPDREKQGRLNMDFALTEAQLKFKSDVVVLRRMVGTRSKSRRSNATASFRMNCTGALDARGWAGVMVPPEFGGMGLGAIEMAIITEEFGRIGFSGLALTLHGQRTLLKLGTPAQQQKYRSRPDRGEILSAIVVSEPDVGSSLKHMKTTRKA